MKVMSMIEALMGVQLWSVVVATGAWFLQRDGGRRIGASFPGPTVWLALIVLCILPGALYLVPFGAAISLPMIDGLALLPIPVSSGTSERSDTVNYFAVYMALSLLLMSRTLWRWLGLQRLPLAPTAQTDVFTTRAELPPLTVSWPRRAVVVPRGFEGQAALIRHERAHLHRNDAELTLLLLLLHDLMLRGPGVGYLVRQWRLSIELRADHVATKMLTTPQRKDYAALLLNLQRPTGNSKKKLPCPTAQLGTMGHREVKMRLVEIMDNRPRERKPRWVAALLFSSIGACAIGLTASVATATHEFIDADSGTIDYVKRTPLQLPSNCPGFRRDDVKTEQKEIAVNGRPAAQYTMGLGTVALHHDIRRDGSVHNPRIIFSTHPCFEANAKIAITQWTTAPHELAIRDAAVKLHFALSSGNPEELNRQLSDFLQ